ncbi:MAG: hypothetical protein ABW189_08855 [Rickettsiales bacterium]
MTAHEQIFWENFIERQELRAKEVSDATQRRIEKLDKSILWLLYDMYKIAPRLTFEEFVMHLSSCGELSCPTRSLSDKLIAYIDAYDKIHRVFESGRNIAHKRLINSHKLCQHPTKQSGYSPAYCDVLSMVVYVKSNGEFYVRPGIEKMDADTNRTENLLAGHRKFIGLCAIKPF